MKTIIFYKILTFLLLGEPLEFHCLIYLKLANYAEGRSISIFLCIEKRKIQQNSSEPYLNVMEWLLANWKYSVTTKNMVAHAG
jgi:hypothetical protein